MARRSIVLACALGVGAVVLAWDGGHTRMQRAKHYGRGRAHGRPIWVVVHTAEIAELPDSAEKLAAYAANPSDGRVVSWHYAVDADSTVQSVAETDTAYASGPGNSRSVQIELAGRASQGAKGWSDDYSRRVVARAGALAGEVCRRWEIPIRRIDSVGVLAFQAGICGHSDISAASQYARDHGMRGAPWWDAKAGRYRITTHTDPGIDFPWGDFLSAAKGTNSV